MVECWMEKLIEEYPSGEFSYEFFTFSSSHDLSEKLSTS